MVIILYNYTIYWWVLNLLISFGSGWMGWMEGRQWEELGRVGGSTHTVKPLEPLEPVAPLELEPLTINHKCSIQFSKVQQISDQLSAVKDEYYKNDENNYFQQLATSKPVAQYTSILHVCIQYYINLLTNILWPTKKT